jgi:hypothetical protein
MASDIQGLSMSANTYQPAAARRVVAALLPIMAAVFAAFLVTGLAMGAYTAFLDLALGLANPALVLAAGSFGLSSVFLASALAVSCSAAVAARLLMRHAGEAMV